MNILFVNYGDFTTNSLNHIAGFAAQLSASGHACAVAVPSGRESIAVIPDPGFQAVEYADVLANPRIFPDGRTADLIHAWTPREIVRRFVLAVQPKIGARLVVHLEDNEDFLQAAWLKGSIADLRGTSEDDLDTRASPSLSHPRRFRQLLRVSDGVTFIVDSLREFVPPDVPSLLLPPGLDFSRIRPAPPDPALRRELGIRDGEKVIVFTGSTTFANEPEMRDLYRAVALLNSGGMPTRLIRSGLNSPAFQAGLSDAERDAAIDLGFIDKARLPALLALADVLVQPGQAGPFNDYRLPSKLAEFLGAGRPVILPATNVGRELRDGEDALLLKSGAPEEIVAACRRVFSDAALAKTLSKNASAFARGHFDLAANTRKLIAFYAEVMAQPSRPGSTARVAEGGSEAPLVLRALASRTADPDVASLASDLAPLVEQLERKDPGRAARTRLQEEVEFARHHQELARRHAENVGKKLDETSRHAGNVQRELDQTSKHAANLADKLAGLKLHLDAVEKKTRESEERLRGRIEHVTTELRLTRQHVVNIESLRDSLQHRVGELGEARDLAAAKIRAMQDAFSWKVTAPLRYLRRILLDPHRRPAASPTPRRTAGPGLPTASPTEADAAHFAQTTDETGLPIWHSVDYPQSWSLPPKLTVVRGWCFADDGRPLKAVRAVLPGRKIEGTYGFKRLDVLASVRTKPQAEYCGWKIEIELAPGDTRLDLETRDDTGVWHRFFHTGLRVGEGFGPLDLTSYEKWIGVYDQPSPETLRQQTAQAARLSRQPLISVLMPVYNTPANWLEKAVASVGAQTYPHWELCIADDASTEPHVRTLLERFSAEDPRIKVVFRPTNGHISESSNSALALAAGEFVALLDHDDELAPSALFEVASAIDARPDTAYLYTDEDKIDGEGRRHEPYFKPDFLPDLFEGQNYTSHLSVYRTALVREVGGFRAGYEGSQDWDLELRAIGRIDPSQIQHIPKVLYHWRAIPGSTALMLSEKNYPLEAARRALTDHFARKGQPVLLSVVPGDHWRVSYPLPASPPLVSLIIPTRNGLKFLQRCVDSILRETAYPAFEVIVMDNGSGDPATLSYLATLSDGTHSLLKPQHTARVIRFDGPFNYSAINNRGVRAANGEIVGLLNNDLEVITPGWLGEMVSHALRPEIGCVGAMLYYPNDTIQHAGAVIGLGGVAGHAFRDQPRGTAGRFNRARLTQNYSAVTAACLIVRKSVYSEVGGLDEKDLAVAFNDIDFCLKVRAAGYRNLWTPFAELYHHESASRGADDTPEKEDRFRREVETMMMRWGPVLTRDPAYNPNLTFEFTDFSLAVPPRPWCPEPAASSSPE